MGKPLKKITKKSTIPINKRKRRKEKIKPKKYDTQKYIFYKPYSIVLREKMSIINKLKKSKKKISIKLKEALEILKEFDLEESFTEYLFSLIDSKNDLDKKNNIDIFIKYMFTLKYEERIKYQNKVFNYLNDLQKKEIKTINMKTLFLELLKEIYNLKIDKKKKSALVQINDLKDGNKYYVAKKKYVVPLVYGNDESIYQEYIYLLFHYLTSHGEKKLIENIELLKVFIPTIISEEFQNHFEDREVFNLMIDYIFILLFISVNYGNKETISKNVTQYFFETKEDKLTIIKNIINSINLNNYIIDEAKNSFKFIHNNRTFDINLYNYSFYNLNHFFHGDVDDFVNSFKKREYFSLEYCFEQKFYISDQIYSKMKELFKGILKSRAYEECISKITLFKNSSNPYNDDYNSDSFFNDLEKNTHYIYIPNKNIDGLTDKKRGITFINTKKRNTALNHIYEVSNYLNTVSQTWTHCHEYGFHWLGCYNNTYILRPIEEMTPVLLFDKDIINLNKNNTQKIVNNDFPNLRKYETYDSGDKGETYLFGNKLTKLYLNGAIFISDINNWNTSLDQFRTNFINCNVETPMKIKESDLSKFFFNKEQLNRNQPWFRGHIITRKYGENDNEDCEKINISSKFNEMHQ